MIVTHPLLFNTIVVLFIAFTSGWLVFVIVSGRTLHMARRIKEMETEKEKLSKHLRQLEEQVKGNHAAASASSTPVITLAAHRVNKTN